MFKIIINLLGILLPFLSGNTDVYAEAWLPSSGKYKMLFSYLSSDKQSVKVQKRLGRKYLGLYNKIYRLELFLQTLSSESALHAQVANRIKQLKKIVDSLSKIASATDLRVFECEYSPDGKSSIGLKTMQTKSSFFDEIASKMPGYRPIITDLFFKRKLIQNKTYVASLKFSSSFRAGEPIEATAESMLLFGQASKHKRFSRFSETGISLEYPIFPRKNERTVAISICNGIEFLNGIKLGVFTKHSFRKIGYKRSFSLYYTSTYKQFWAAKELVYGKCKINFSLGYFEQEGVIGRLKNKNGGLAFSIGTEF